MKAIGYITATVGLMVYGAIMNGWALSKLWAWFIVTSFDVPALTVPAAIGFALVVNYLTQKSDLEKKDCDEDYSKILFKGAVMATFKPLFALGFGAVVRLWL